MKDKICIYCMGEYGIEMYYQLKRLGITADCFGDRDTEKHGYALEGVFCISYEEVCELDKNTIIIVSIKYPQELINHFRGHGFTKVWNRTEALRILGKGRTRALPKTIKTIENARVLKEQIQNGLSMNGNEMGCNDDIEQLVLDYKRRNNKT